MPSYTATLKVEEKGLVPGGTLKGEIIYNTNRQCELKDAKLRLYCVATFFSDEGILRRSRHNLESRKIRIPILHTDAGGRREVHKQETLHAHNEQNKFHFEETLAPDLLPSTDGDVRNILDVSYTLVLTSQRGVFGGKRVDGTPTTICIKPRVNLWKDRLGEIADKELTINDWIFRQGFSILASAHLPKCGWNVGEQAKLSLTVLNFSSGSIRSLKACLERTIMLVSKNKPVCVTSVVAKSADRTPPGSLTTFSVDLPVYIPLSCPVLDPGVIYSTNVSILYRIKVEVRSNDNSLPALNLYLPVLLGRTENARNLQTESQSQNSQNYTSVRQPSQGSPSARSQTRTGGQSTGSSRQNATRGYGYGATCSGRQHNVNIQNPSSLDTGTPTATGPLADSSVFVEASASGEADHFGTSGPPAIAGNQHPDQRRNAAVSREDVARHEGHPSQTSRKCYEMRSLQRQHDSIPQAVRLQIDMKEPRHGIPGYDSMRDESHTEVKQLYQRQLGGLVGATAEFQFMHELQSAGNRDSDRKPLLSTPSQKKSKKRRTSPSETSAM